MQDSRQWVDGGAIVSAESANEARNKVSGAFRKARGEVDFYELLEVERDATPEQIKKQYYALAKKWHPGGSQKQYNILGFRV